jgi:hypothetical protein
MVDIREGVLREHDGLGVDPQRNDRYGDAKFQSKTVDFALNQSCRRCWSEYRAISSFAEAAADAQLVLEMLRAAKTRLTVTLAVVEGALT